MHATIVLSGIIQLAEESDSRVRREAWDTLNAFFGIFNNTDIIQKCYPGILKCLANEIQTFKNQGIGTSRFAFETALEIFSQILIHLDDKDSSE